MPGAAISSGPGPAGFARWFRRPGVCCRSARRLGRTRTEGAAVWL